MFKSQHLSILIHKYTVPHYNTDKTDYTKYSGNTEVEVKDPQTE